MESGCHRVMMRRHTLSGHGNNIRTCILQTFVPQQKVKTMNIFVVENSTVMAESLQSMLASNPGIEVVGHSVEERDAIERIDALLPDAVIMDIGLQSGSGFVVLESIKKHHVEIKVMVLTHYTSKENTDRCKLAGADYFFDKSFQLAQARDVLWEWSHPTGKNPLRQPQ